MTLYGYDSADPAKIPADPPVVFPYGDGDYAWSHARFPKASYRYITVKGNPQWDILDWEPGCVYNPDTLRSWVQTRHSHGEGAVVYCNRSEFPNVREILAGLDHQIFLSTLDGTAVSEYDGVKLVACQFITESGYDKSEIYDESWPVKP